MVFTGLCHTVDVKTGIVKVENKEFPDAGASSGKKYSLDLKEWESLRAWAIAQGWEAP